MTTPHIKKLWKEVSDEYLKKFCEALDIDIADAYWIGDDPGTIAQAGDYFVGIHEMRFLVDNNIDPDLFLKWNDYTLSLHELQEAYSEMEGFTRLNGVNFESFAKGVRPYSKEQINKMWETLSAIQKAKESFQQQYKEMCGQSSQ